MTTMPEPMDRIPAGRLQSRLAVAMLGVVAGTWLFLSVLVHVEPLKVWMRQLNWEQNRVKQTLPLYCYTGHYVDYEERFIHEQLPDTDFRRGGVYFLGASTLKWSLKTWDLPDETRPFIHNFGFGGVHHSDQSDFLHYLIENEKSLNLDPQKTLFVFGTNYRIVHNGRAAGQGPGEYFRQLLTRHGFYTVDPDGTIRQTPIDAFTRYLRLEPARVTGFLREAVNLVYFNFRKKRVHNVRYYNDEWIKAMGPEWNQVMDDELDYLKKLFEFLKQRKFQTAVVLFPMGTWDKELPYEPVYVEKLTKICEAEGVKIHDFRQLLDDDDFADSDHLNPNGTEKFQRAVMGLSLDHLRSTGVLPAGAPAQRP